MLIIHSYYAIPSAQEISRYYDAAPCYYKWEEKPSANGGGDFGRTNAKPKSISGSRQMRGTLQHLN